MSISVGQAAVARRLDVGEIINAAAAAGRRNLKTLVLLALIWVALPEAVISLLTLSLDNSARWTSSIAGLLAVVFSGASAHLILQDFAGRHVSLRDAQEGGLKLILPLLGVSILAGLGVALGLLLLIVPGVILAIMWAVVMPARVAEGPGVMAAFHRSRELTRGCRWTISLVYLVSLVPLIIILAVAALLVGAIGENHPLSVGVISPLSSAAVSLIFGVLPPVLYAKLREVKEGGASSTVADIFS